jgi:cupin 2 domain-containing protein
MKAPSVENIFARLPKPLGPEQVSTLFENEAVEIERIVSHSSSSPAGFWYDQPRDEWVIVFSGHATLEFEGGELFEMREGDYVTIPRHVKHRVAKTGAETIWLAVHIKSP